jgi:hypothetical protein
MRNILSNNGVRTFAFIIILVFLSGTHPHNSFADEKKKDKTWEDFKRKVIKGIPDEVKNSRERLARAKIVKRPKTELESFEDSVTLWISINSFYSYISKRELDVYEEQEGIPGYFPDRSAYYDFLDTVLPAMRDRRFERNRILNYKIHEITAAEDEPGNYDVVMSVDSDDIFPFGKIMIFSQRWRNGPRGWYPGKVEAEPATWLERVR